ncbi:MAG: glycosyltransferase family 39 protein [Candidatus Eisenbacteria bacterium]
MVRRIGGCLIIPLDGILLVGSVFVLCVIASGGGVYHIAGIRISSFSASNPIHFLFVLGALRFLAFRGKPFLGIPRLRPADLPGAAERLCRGLHARLSGLSDSGATRVVLLIILLSAVIKVLNAWFYFGFFAGDDVEVHQMTFAKIFGWHDWRAWDLRSPFYPFVFLYPVQAFLRAGGAESTALLVFAGRLVVIGFSLLTLWLLYHVGRREFGSAPAAILGVIALALSSLHTTHASSELPRTVSGFFILLVFFFVHPDRPTRRWPILLGSAIALGIGVSIRFSEIVFLAPLAISLALERRFSRAVVVGFLALVVAAAILGVSDRLYRGDALHSARHIIQYTLIEKQSSRGHEPFHEYLRDLGAWSSVFAAVVFFLSIRLRRRRLLLWALVPVLALSFLPHKEPRYLVPMLPFFAALVGGSIWRLLSDVYAGVGESRLRMGHRTKALVLVAIVSTASLLEIDRFRFRRSETAVEAARWISRSGPVRGVAVVQFWKAGGLLYLWRVPVIEEIARENLGDREYISGVMARPEIEYFLLPQKDIDRYEYGPLLLDSGYSEIEFTHRVTNNNYRLFRRIRRGDAA